MSISPAGVPQLTPAEAARSADGGALLLDVREDDEWQAGHAPEAVHLALGNLSEGYRSLPQDRRIVAICRIGGRSERAAIALRDVGYDVVNLAGGMQAWAAAGQPVVTDDGSTGRVI